MSERARLAWRHAPADEEPGRDRWLLSYADFITLLLAFFVVLYSISSVNNGKFRVLSKALEIDLKANPKTARPLERPRAVPIDMGGGAPPRESLLDAPRNVADLQEAAGADSINAETPALVAPPALPVVGTPREKLLAAIGAFGGRDDVKLRETRDWLEIELGSEVLFATGSATLNAAALPALAQIAAVVADMGHAVRVEGFTDNVALTGGPYGSNWGLSAARAATIADYLATARVMPEKLAAIGYGEHRPIADNLTPAGRRQNRRVVVAIGKNDQITLAGDATAAAQPSLEPPVEEAAQSLQRVMELPGPAEIPE
ncbi:MAG: flagellar motor protein MotD [Gammaproteobacteria bacterium]|nr:flagellar motor protein MotD [Gammaproteobacteria bacterium]